jgi:hypothetical protein
VDALNLWRRLMAGDPLGASGLDELDEGMTAIPLRLDQLRLAATNVAEAIASTPGANVDVTAWAAGALVPEELLLIALSGPAMAQTPEERDMVLQSLLSGVRNLLDGAQRQLHQLAPFPPPPADASDLEREAHRLLTRYVDEAVGSTYTYVWNVRPGDHAAGRAILEAAPATQIAVIIAAVERVQWLAVHLQRTRSSYNESVSLKPLIGQICRRRQPYAERDIVALLTLLASAERHRWLYGVPLPTILSGVERWTAEHGLPAATRPALEQLRRSVADASYRTVDDRKALSALDQMLGLAPHEAVAIDSVDDWGHAAAQALAELEGVDRERWLALLAHAAIGSSAKPSRAWLTKARRLTADLGETRFKELAIAWLGLLGAPSRNATYRHPSGYPEAMPSAIVAERNAEILKRLLWCCGLFDEPALARAVGDATIACFKKIPEYGARSAKAGNAGLWALGAMPGASGVAQLQRLAQRVKGAAPQKQIEAALAGAAERAGLTRADLDELAVPTFGLTDGRLRQAFGDYTAELVVGGTHAVDVRWERADGRPLKGEPAEVKRACPDELKALKGAVKDIQATLPAQRDRIERLLLTERSWRLADWRARYLDHALLSVLTRRLVWWFLTDDRAVLGAWRDGALVDVDDRPLDWLTDDTRVRLWHPIGGDPATVLAWRRWLERHGVTQPFKQAHREVYLLTDAELATHAYSNRFAAHILRQHQLNALARARGWRTQLQGGWDGGDAVMPTLTLPDWELRAEYWVEGIFDGAGETLSNAGVCLYVTTDQVRFTRLDGRVVPLTEVPALVFTEVMRDVDLFVGVASVGNDPAWRDGGLERYQAYWHDYSFGDLSASAQTRRAVLEGLLPRLKIADRCSLADRFLVVRGDLRTYKIHLGSGNILMEPNSQYLCIVPDRGGRSRPAEGTTFLPFEGDPGLAIILSKAFLLANDRAIKDPSIVMQIRFR